MFHCPVSSHHPGPSLCFFEAISPETSRQGIESTHLLRAQVVCHPLFPPLHIVGRRPLPALMEIPSIIPMTAITASVGLPSPDRGRSPTTPTSGTALLRSPCPVDHLRSTPMIPSCRYNPSSLETRLRIPS
jgi:hypothetical protein